MKSKFLKINDKKNRFKKDAGFTFIEVMAAVFVIAVGVSALVQVMPSIISDTSIDNSRLKAAYLAQEGIEIVRNIRDSNELQGEALDYGLTNCSGGCEADYACVGVNDPSPSNPPGHDCFSQYSSSDYLKISSTNGFYNYESGTPSSFTRKITIISQSPSDLDVQVEVFWSDRGTPYNFTAEEKLYNWY